MNGISRALLRFVTTVESWIVVIGAILALLIGHLYASSNGLATGVTTILGPAVQYACTGEFKPHQVKIRTEFLGAFLKMKRAGFPCLSEPVATTTEVSTKGNLANNVDMPTYQLMLHALLWRWFGVQWATTYWIIGGFVALSFLSMYLCARRFMPHPIAALLILSFIVSPLYITQLLSLRDSLQFPFPFLVAAVLIAGPSTPTPRRFILFAGLVGLIIGIGYGFHSSLLLFLIPAGIILAGVWQMAAGTFVAQFLVRSAAIGVLLFSFCVGAWMPLVNDYERGSAYFGESPLIMGLATAVSAKFLDQSEGKMYLLPTATDDNAATRVVDYALRRDGQLVEPYSKEFEFYARQYYLDAISYMPADLIVGGVGAFVNLMTVPASLFGRLPQVGGTGPRGEVDFDPQAPWSNAYASAGEAWSGLLKRLDSWFRFASTWPIVAVFVTNVVILFLFLCLLTETFSVWSAIAFVLLLGATLMVLSVNFWLRHMYYLYGMLVISWGAVVFFVFGTPPVARSLKTHIRTAKRVAVIVLAVFAGIVSVVPVARAFQVHRLRTLIEDWVNRPTIAASVEVVSSGADSLIRILSPIPTAAGGVRQVDSPVTEKIETGMARIEIDGKLCNGQLLFLFSKYIHPGVANESIVEPMFVELKEKTDYLAFFPVFYYNHYYSNLPSYSSPWHSFAGFGLDTRQLPCVKNVSFVTEFKQNDLLMNLFVPEDPRFVDNRDLYDRIIIPGIGPL